MKQIITFTFLICSLACLGQKEKATARGQVLGDPPGNPPEWQTPIKSIQFSAFEKGEMADFEATQKQLIKIFRSQDSLKAIFLQKFLTRNGVDLSRLSQHPDSLKIKPEGIEYILKSKTQKQ